MPKASLLLAVLVAAIWGINFVFIRLALDDLPPLLLTAVRFAICAVPVIFLPRPQMSWARLIAAGTFLFTLTFTPLFIGMDLGMPPGIAGTVMQTQVFVTALLAAVFLGENPTARQWAGTAIGFLGIVIIGTTFGGEGSLIGFILCLFGAASWGAGNVLMRGMPPGGMVARMSWLCLVAFFPVFVLSLVIEGPQRAADALLGITWSGVASVLFISVAATTLGFGLWGYLLQRHPAPTVAPFSMLVPVFGASSAALLLGETFDMARLVGIALVIGGVATTALPWRRKKPVVSAEAAFRSPATKASPECRDAVPCPAPSK